MFEEYLTIGQAVSVVFTGIVVVFLALLILIGFLYAMGAVFKSINKKNAANGSSGATAPAKPAPAAASQNGVSKDVVAAITAAITCIWAEEGNNSPFVIKSIEKTNGTSRNA